MFYSRVHVTFGLLNTSEEVFYGGGGRDFYRKQINGRFQLKREVQVTCLTANLLDLSLSRQLMKLTLSFLSDVPLIRQTKNST